METSCFQAHCVCILLSEEESQRVARTALQTPGLCLKKKKGKQSPLIAASSLVYLLCIYRSLGLSDLPLACFLSKTLFQVVQYFSSPNYS